MIDPKLIRENPKKIKKNVSERNFDPKLVDKFLSIDEKKLELISKVEELKAERNKLTEKFKKQKPEKDEIEKARKLRDKINLLDEKAKKVDSDWQKALSVIPNLAADDVPIGKSDKDNVEIKKVGKISEIEKPKDHVEIGERLGIIDVKRAAKVSGSRFGYFVGDGAVLEMSLMWWAYQKLVEKGFTATIPPVIIKKEIEEDMGYSEHGGWDQAYVIDKDDAVFVSSSEHSVIPMYKDELVDEKDLPKKFVNFSTCFRREAGSYGKDTQGLFRVHQFNKVEMNIYTVPDYSVSDKECEKMLAIQEEIVSELGLPYQVVKACTGDLPFPNRRMYDINTWFPGQGKYRETHSCSNCGDFQTRRLNIRAKTSKGNQFVHALNATVATDRLVLAIIENNQQKDGSIKIPKPLQSLVKKKAIK